MAFYPGAIAQEEQHRKQQRKPSNTGSEIQKGNTESEKEVKRLLRNWATPRAILAKIISHPQEK